MFKTILHAVLQIALFSPLAQANYSGLDLISDKNIEVETSKKAYTVAYFLSSSCPCSQAHFTHLNELQKKYPKFKFVGFHSSKAIPKEKAKKYFDQFDIDFPILFDRDLRFANELSALKTPHVFVLDNQGKKIYQGAATNSRNPDRADKFYLKEVLADINAGKDPQYTSIKSIGCYIQR